MRCEVLVIVFAGIILSVVAAESSTEETTLPPVTTTPHSTKLKINLESRADPDETSRKVNRLERELDKTREYILFLSQREKDRLLDEERKRLENPAPVAKDGTGNFPPQQMVTQPQQPMFSPSQPMQQSGFMNGNQQFPLQNAAVPGALNPSAFVANGGLSSILSPPSQMAMGDQSRQLTPSLFSTPVQNALQQQQSALGSNVAFPQFGHQTHQPHGLPMGTMPSPAMNGMDGIMPGFGGSGNSFGFPSTNQGAGMMTPQYGNNMVSREMQPGYGTMGNGMSNQGLYNPGAMMPQSYNNFG